MKEKKNKLKELEKKIKEIKKENFLTDEMYQIELENLQKQKWIETVKKNKNIIPYAKIYRG